MVVGVIVIVVGGVVVGDGAGFESLRSPDIVDSMSASARLKGISPTLSISLNLFVILDKRRKEV